MKNIKLSLWGLLLGLTGVWLLANIDLPDTLNFMCSSGKRA